MNLDGAGGDTTYTDVLLKCPPPGVEYTTYEDALAQGLLLDRAARASVVRRLHQGVRRGRWERDLWRDMTLCAVNAVVNRARRRGWLYRETFRFYRLVPGVFDAVHVHVFSASFDKLDCPLVLSAGGPVRHMYEDARGFPRWRTRLLDVFDAAFGRLLRVNIVDKNLPQVDRVLVYSQGHRNAIIKGARISPERVAVVPPFLPARAATVRHVVGHGPLLVGFVARDFEAKGGYAVLSAWREIHRALPEARLVIIGSDPAAYTHLLVGHHGVLPMPYMPRDKLVNELMPQLAMLLYPSTSDYLPSYTLLEALSAGVPVAAFEYSNMAEVLGLGGVVVPRGDTSGLAERALDLLDVRQLPGYRSRALEQFLIHYSSQSVLPKIAQAYSGGPTPVCRAAHREGR